MTGRQKIKIKEMQKLPEESSALAFKWECMKTNYKRKSGQVQVCGFIGQRA